MRSFSSDSALYVVIGLGDSRDSVKASSSTLSLYPMEDYEGGSCIDN